MKSKLVTQAALLFCSCLVLAACNSNSSSGEPISLYGELDPTNHGECTQNPNAGRFVNLIQVDQSFQDSGYFHKIIRLGQLDEILGASAKSIASHLIAQDVKVYRMIEDRESKCQYFSFLQAPSAKAQQTWDRLSGDSDSGGSVLLGLFTTLYSKLKGSGKVSIKEPTIMVRHDTQKWTLVHEMAHYLFAKGRIQELHMPFQDELLKEIEKNLESFQSNMESYQENNEDTYAKAAIHSFRQIFELNHKINIQGPLEEFTIESMLVERTQKDLVTHIDLRHNLRNAYRYMKSNSDVAVEMYEELLKVLLEFEDTFKENNSDEVLENFDHLVIDMQNQIDFIDKKLANAYSEMLNVGVMQSSPLSNGRSSLVEKVGAHFDLEIVERQKELISNL